jgi:hypothetical protein
MMFTDYTEQSCTAGRSSFTTDRRCARFLGSQRIWRVRSAKPAVGIELMADLSDLACAAGCFSAGAISGF